MNRIDKKFRQLRQKGSKALVIYITAGYPSLAKTKELIFQLEKSGADIIELGIPFSDPLADGPTIQLASERALKGKASLKGIISLVKDARKKTEVPLVFMTYYNPVLHFGLKRFTAELKAAGVDGVIIPDLPPEEAAVLRSSCRQAGIANIFLLTPTSAEKRVKMISKSSSGFIYYVSLAGVTGARKSLPKEIKDKIKAIKRLTDKPVCVGFGVSNASQAKEMSGFSDGVIVGSAVINIMHKNLGKRNLVKKVGNFVKGLSNATKQ